MKEEDRTKGKERLDEKIKTATEAEADPGRHAMEEAILATLAKGGPGDPFNETFSQAYNDRTLTFGPDREPIAKAIHDFICLQGAPVDTILIRDKLSSAGARVNEAILAGILDGSKDVDAAIAAAYIAKLNRLDKYRALDNVGLEFTKAVDKIRKKGLEPEEAVLQLLNVLTSYGETTKIIRSYQNEAEASEGFLDELSARRSDGRDFIGLDSGFRHLNEILNGLKTGVIILAAMPSLGKTTLAKQIADHVAVKEKVPVLFYTFEQSAEELRIKSLARLSSVDSRVIEKGRTNQETWSKVENAEKNYRQGPGPYLKIIEGGRSDTVEAIRAAALMAKRKAGAERILLVIDYLQIIPSGDNARDALRERIDMILTDLRRLARDLKSPILVVSSMNRAAYKRGKDGISRPTMTALKESGGIEYSADVVICLWKDKEESKKLTKDITLTTDRIEALILKNRNGEQNKRVKMNFTKAWSMFDEEGRVADLEPDEDE
jgi:replicative DNA helicase